MKKLLPLLFVSVVLCSSSCRAEIMSNFWMKISTNNYVTWITQINPYKMEYVHVDFAVDIPDDIMRGYYQWIDGRLVLDTEKKDEWIARFETPVSSPAAVGGE